MANIPVDENIPGTLTNRQIFQLLFRELEKYPNLTVSQALQKSVKVKNSLMFFLVIHFQHLWPILPREERSNREGLSTKN